MPVRRRLLGWRDASCLVFSFYRFMAVFLLFEGIVFAGVGGAARFAHRLGACVDRLTAVSAVVKISDANPKHPPVSLAPNLFSAGPDPGTPVKRGMVVARLRVCRDRSMRKAVLLAGAGVALVAMAGFGVQDEFSIRRELKQGAKRLTR